MKNLLNRWKLFTESAQQLPISTRDFFRDLANFFSQEEFKNGLRKSDIIRKLQGSYSISSINRHLEELLQKNLASSTRSDLRQNPIIKLTDTGLRDYGTTGRRTADMARRSTAPEIYSDAPDADPSVRPTTRPEITSGETDASQRGPRQTAPELYSDAPGARRRPAIPVNLENHLDDIGIKNYEIFDPRTSDLVDPEIANGKFGFYEDATQPRRTRRKTRPGAPRVGNRPDIMIRTATGDIFVYKGGTSNLYGPIPESALLDSANLKNALDNNMIPRYRITGNPNVRDVFDTGAKGKPKMRIKDGELRIIDPKTGDIDTIEVEQGASRRVNQEIANTEAELSRRDRDISGGAFGEQPYMDPKQVRKARVKTQKRIRRLENQARRLARRGQSLPDKKQAELEALEQLLDLQDNLIETLDKQDVSASRRAVEIFKKRTARLLRVAGASTGILLPIMYYDLYDDAKKLGATPAQVTRLIGSDYGLFGALTENVLDTLRKRLKAALAQYQKARGDWSLMDREAATQLILHMRHLGLVSPENSKKLDQYVDLMKATDEEVLPIDLEGTEDQRSRFRRKLEDPLYDPASEIRGLFESKNTKKLKITIG